MNVLLIVGLVLFAGAVFWIYALFLSSINRVDEKQEVEVDNDDALEYCNKLYEQGLHAELQRYAQRKLAKKYNDIELRRILAKSFLETENDRMAIMHYEAILTISPRDPDALDVLASYYCEHGPKNRAIDLYEKIYALDGGNFNAVETLAKLYEETNDNLKAIEMYTLILNAEIDEQKITELKYILAELYIKIGNNVKAFETYDEIYKNDTENLEILMILADLAYKNKYWQDCLKYYKKITSIVGDDFEMLEKIAQMYVMLEKWPEAIEAYQKIIALEEPTSLNYLYHQNELCNALLKNDQCEEAVATLKELIKQYPKETSLTFTLASAYASVGEFQTGLNLYNKLLEDLPPEQGEIIIQHISNMICAWGQDLFAKGKYSQAFDKFFEALKYNEENDDVYFQLGRCNYYIKSMQDAISHFKRAVAIKPQESKYYFGLGCAYDEMGNIKAAKSSFLDAVNIDPMNVKARIAYAISLTKELEYAQSIEQFLEALKQVPDNADTLYNTALAYELVGDKEHSLEYYKKALQVMPDHKEAKHNIELLLGEPYVVEGSSKVRDKDNKEESELTDKTDDASNDETEDLNFDISDNNDNQESMFS